MQREVVLQIYLKKSDLEGSRELLLMKTADKTVQVKIATILQGLNVLMEQIDIASIPSVLIKVESKWRNIFWQRYKKVCVNLQNNKFVVQVCLAQNEVNLVERMRRCLKNQTRVRRSLQELGRRATQQTRCKQKQIDVAYLFADPLVTYDVNKNNPPVVSLQVSYLREYDSFVQQMKEVHQHTQRYIRAQSENSQQFKSRYARCHTRTYFQNFSRRGQNYAFLLSRNINRLGKPSTQRCNNQFNCQKGIIDEIHRYQKPELIIFNVCFSDKIAKAISQKYGIWTIGYTKQANDVCCEYFSSHFYERVFNGRLALREVFERIKHEISCTPGWEEQAEMMVLHPKDGNITLFEGVSNEAESNEETPLPMQNTNWIKRWDYVQNLGKDEPIGVKLEAYHFIKDYLTQNVKIATILLHGPPFVGKTLFLRKVKQYTMLRGAFTHEVWLECLPNQTMLSFRISHNTVLEELLSAFAKVKGKAKCLLIFDHCTQLMRNQWPAFHYFLQHKIRPALRECRIILVSNFLPADTKNTIICPKQSLSISNIKELSIFVNRYCDKSFQMQSSQSKNQFLKKVFNEHMTKHTHEKVIKALKFSLSPAQFQSKLKAQINIKLKAQDIKIPKSQQIIKETTTLQYFLLLNHYNASVYDFFFFSSVLTADAKHIKSENFQDQIIKKHFALQIKELKGNLKKIPLHPNMSFTQVRDIFAYGLNCLTLAIINQDYNEVKQILFDFHVLQFDVQNLINSSEKELCVQMRFFVKVQTFLLFCGCFLKKNKNANEDEKKEIKGEMSMLEQQIESCFDKRHALFFKKMLQMGALIDKIQEEESDKLELVTLNDKELFAIEGMGDLFVAQPKEQKGEHNLKEEIRKADEIIHKYEQTLCELQKSCTQIGTRECALRERTEMLSKASCQLLHLIIVKPINRIILFISQLNLLKYEGALALSAKIKYYLTLLDSKATFISVDHSCLRPVVKPLVKVYLHARAHGLKVKEMLFPEGKSINQFLKVLKDSRRLGFKDLTSIVQDYIQQNYFNTCMILISQPLVNHKKAVLHTLRYENRFNTFIQYLFESKVNKVIQYDIQTLSRESLKILEQKSVFLYLLICDCDAHSETIFFEGIYLEEKRVQVKICSLPRAPIVICFGRDVHILQKNYRETHDSNYPYFLILINKKQTKDPLKNHQKEDLEYFTDYYFMEKLFECILQSFYGYFCENLFNKSYDSFEAQVKSSFFFARDQTYLKLVRDFARNSERQRLIWDCLKDISLLQLRENISTPMYSFVQKEAGKYRIKSDYFYSVMPEIGNNLQIKEAYVAILQLQKELQRTHPATIQVCFKHQTQLNLFMKSLQIRLIRNAIFQKQTNKKNKTNLFTYVGKKQECRLFFNQDLNNQDPFTNQNLSRRQSSDKFQIHLIARNYSAQKDKYRIALKQNQNPLLYYLYLKDQKKQNFKISWDFIQKKYLASKKNQELTFTKIDHFVQKNKKYIDQ